MQNEHGITGIVGFLTKYFSTHASQKIQVFPIILDDKTLTQEATELAKKIEKNFTKKDTIVIISMDMSHDLFPQIANFHDITTFEAIKNLDENADTLLFDALLLPEVIEDAFNTRQVQKLTDYLKSLAASLHKFYYDVRMIGTDDEAKLLKLMLIVALSIKTGLSLMGIEAKDRMSKEEE